MGVRSQCPFFGAVFVCLKPRMQVHSLLVFCLRTAHMSSVALPRTCPSQIQHSLRNSVRSTVLLKKPLKEGGTVHELLEGSLPQRAHGLGFSAAV